MSRYLPSTSLVQASFALYIAISIDYFHRQNPQRSSADVPMRTEALAILGSPDRVYEMSVIYFASTHYKLPVISQARFYNRLPSLFVSGAADFAVLCLGMHLVQQTPSLPTQSMVSSLYTTVKTSMSLLEATGYNSLDTIQCRLLVVLYEMGHGLYPAASISIGACARAARNMGLHPGSLEAAEPTSTEVIDEERRRTWWAVHNLDSALYLTSDGRFINLYGGDAVFATEDANIEDPLPAEDGSWSQNALPDTVRANLSTPAAFKVGQFARECQVSHLVGRVVRHVFNPISDPNFHADEAAQLERTLMSLVPLLTEEELKFRNYCGALAISLFTLYTSAMLRSENRDVDESRTLPAIDALSTRIAELSEHLLAVAQDEANKLTLSPYLPYVLYQTAVAQDRLWKQKNDVTYKHRAETMVSILRCFKDHSSINLPTDFQTEDFREIFSRIDL
ncbi:Transcription factor [Penicillium occitanis (nom. inval.)]|nr:Transcription factor [Penicillium occitanis (nom. inval.)]PCH07454.1 hypothetical protein PENOC_019040 [Penicillium occitanis (nom. inval.)]